MLLAAGVIAVPLFKRLGLAQVLVCIALLTAAGAAAGLSSAVAFIAASGFVLSSTAIVMQLLDESGDTSAPRGQRIVSILLLEDLAIVPLLAIVAFLSPAPTGEAVSSWVTVGVALAAVVGLVSGSRARDAERLQQELGGDKDSARNFFHGNNGGPPRSPSPSARAGRSTKRRPTPSKSHCSPWPVHWPERKAA